MEQRTCLLLAQQQPMAADLRMLVTVLRVIHEIERIGDLMGKVAKATRRLYPNEIDPRMRGLIDRMRDQASAQLRLAVEAFADRDVARAAALADMDDVMDELQKELFQAIFSVRSPDDSTLQLAVQMALVGRYYERAGDHAANVADRVTFMVTGHFSFEKMPPTSAAKPTIKHADRRSVAALGALALIWGSSFLWIEVALEGLTPTQVVAGRLPRCRCARRGGAARRTPATHRASRSGGSSRRWRSIQNVVPFALFAWGQQRISSSIATVMNATTPLWTAAFAAVAMLPGERLSRRRVGALLAGFAGVVVIVEPWRRRWGQIIGELACLAAAACYGVGFMFLSRNVLGKMQTMAAAVGQIISGAVIATAMAVVTTAASGDAPHFDLQIVGAILALGALGTGVAFLFSYYLVETTGPTATSTVTFLMPFVGVLLGVLVLDEHLRWTLAAGGALVILSAVRVRREARGAATLRSLRTRLSTCGAGVNARRGIVRPRPTSNSRCHRCAPGGPSTPNAAPVGVAGRDVR